MDVEIQARAKAPYEGHGACVRLAGLAALARRLLVVPRELLGVNARQRAKHLGLVAARSDSSKGNDSMAKLLGLRGSAFCLERS